jgi:hypothetical protein
VSGIKASSLPAEAYHVLYSFDEGGNTAPPPSYTMVFHTIIIIIIIIIISVVRLSPRGTVATIGPLYQPQMIDDCDCVAISEIEIGRGD